MDVSWTIKKAEHQRIDAFETARTARRSNQCILKEISPEYSLEGLMLKLKLQYLATWCVRGTNSLEKTLMLGKMEGRRRGQQRMRCLDGHRRLDELEFEQARGVGDGREAWQAAVHGVTMTEWLNWTEFYECSQLPLMPISRWLQNPISSPNFHIAHCTLFSVVHCTYPSLMDIQIQCSNLNSLNLLSFIQNWFLFLCSLQWLMHMLVMLFNIPSTQLPIWDTWETFQTCFFALTSHLIATESQRSYL